MNDNPLKLNAIFTEDFISNPGRALGIKTPTENEFEKYVHDHSFNINKLPPEDSHLFFYNGIPIGSRGNLLAITGKAKSRKTVVASAIATSAFVDGEFLGFTADIPKGDNILHIDTEQGYYHYYGSVTRIFKDANYKGIPENFHSIHTRDATSEFRVELLEYLFGKLKPRVAILDGITDFVRDINNQDEATKISEILLRLSYQYDALIIVVIHTTKTTGYMTGAVGTTLEKKAQTVIKVERDDDNEKGDPNISHVSCQYARDKGFKSFSIQYVEELGRYDATPESEIVGKGRRGDKRPENYADDVHKLILTRMFGYREEIPDPQLQDNICKALKQVTGDNIATLEKKQFVKFYNDRAMIFMNPSGAWMRPPAGTTSNHTAADETGQLFLQSGAPPSPSNGEATDDLPF
jgi:KaiC/GvpD/RAD55 family RecA-like ATPase